MIPSKLQIKVFATGLDDELVPQVIPVFHRWITERALDEVLVDVADYRHVFQGPGITLIGHESTYHLDEQGGRRGLVYVRKRGFTGSDEGALLEAVRRALAACERLERELGAEGKLFDVGTLQVRAADRTAIDSASALAAFAERVIARLANVYPGDPQVDVLGDGGLPGVELRWKAPPPVTELLARLPFGRARDGAVDRQTLEG